MLNNVTVKELARKLNADIELLFSWAPSQYHNLLDPLQKDMCGFRRRRCPGLAHASRDGRRLRAVFDANYEQV